MSIYYTLLIKMNLDMIWPKKKIYYFHLLKNVKRWLNKLLKGHKKR